MLSPCQYQSFSHEVTYLRHSTLPAHSCVIHAHFECFYIRQGEVRITIDGSSTTLRAGDLSLTAPFLLHANELAAGAKVDILTFSPSICPQAARLFESRKPARPYLRKSELPALVEQLMRSMPAILSTLSATVRKQEFSTSYRLKQADCQSLGSYLSVLLLELAKAMPLVPLERAATGIMQNVLSYCSANFTQDISRETVAQACHVSTGVVSQVFSQINTSFRDYINFLRTSEAYCLLTTTNLPITEIIYECGYSNQGTFNRNFFLKYGKTPRQIRSS